MSADRIALSSSSFLRACARQRVDRTPVWLMRQAGRYMPEYRKIREKYTMMDMVNTPELAAEVTLQPVDAFDVDAAIIFSDLLPPLIAMGLDLEYVKGDGPRFHNPIRSEADVDGLGDAPVTDVMAGTLGAVRIVAGELTPRDIPLIGFAGAPFTLASYAIEGGGSSNYARVKTFMHTQPQAWTRLMGRLVDLSCDYLLAQAQAGASALQVFDSWAGLALGVRDYERFVQPHNKALFERLRGASVPVINFSAGTASYIEHVAQCGGDVIGIDWRMPIDWVWERVGLDKPVQGNLDPIVLLGSWDDVKRETDDVLARVAGRPGHIFNLGHGINKETPVDNVRRLVDYVHERTS